MALSPTDTEAPSPKGTALRKEHEQEYRKVGVRERLKHFTWAWFLSTMSTGGLAIILAETPHKFHGKAPTRAP
jgi:hypothetical protein